MRSFVAKKVRLERGKKDKKKEAVIYSAFRMRLGRTLIFLGLFGISGILNRVEATDLSAYRPTWALGQTWVVSVRQYDQQATAPTLQEPMLWRYTVEEEEEFNGQEAWVLVVSAYPAETLKAAVYVRKSDLQILRVEKYNGPIDRPTILDVFPSQGNAPVLSDGFLPPLTLPCCAQAEAEREYEYIPAIDEVRGSSVKVSQRVAVEGNQLRVDWGRGADQTTQYWQNGQPWWTRAEQAGQYVAETVAMVSRPLGMMASGSAALSALAGAWDRYSNDSEYWLGNYSFQKIMRYSFSVGAAGVVTLETANTSGDTYMYLWSETESKQIAIDDDSGAGTCSRISVWLRPGSYTAFIRSYNNNQPAYCDLYKNGTRVITQGRYSGNKVYVGALRAETRFRTTDLSSGSDTYCLLLDSRENMIGYNDDSEGVGSMIVAAEKPSYFVIGSYGDGSEGTCSVRYTQDNNMEYLALCGNENRNAVSGNCFINYFNSGSYYYEHVLQSTDWEFRGPDRMSYVDGVDLIFIHAHGGWGQFGAYNGADVDFTADEASAGGGHRTNNRSGDLEYAAFMTCQTVRIEDPNSWGWLVNTGWQSKYNPDGSIQKGFFDGVHVVVGYHTDHSNISRPFLDHDSNWYEARYFADNLDAGQSIWDAWKNANRSATDETHSWIWCSDVDLGEISSIHIVPQQDEGIGNRNSTDYKLGDSNYYFGWRKSHYWWD